MPLPPVLRLTSLQSRVHHPVHSAVARALAARLAVPVEEAFDGDWRELRAELSEGTVHLGTLCSPYYLEELARSAPRWEALAALAPVTYLGPDEAQPLARYASKVVVRADSPAMNFEALRGQRFGFNEPMSLSGYHSMRIGLAERGEVEHFFGELIETGGHRASLRALRAGEVDVIALDSTVEDYFRRHDPEGLEGVRSVAQLGPFPHPPLVAHTSLAPTLRARLRTELTTLHQEVEVRAVLERFGFARLVPLEDGDFDALRGRLEHAATVRVAPVQRDLGRAFTGCS